MPAVVSADLRFVLSVVGDGEAAAHHSNPIVAWSMPRLAFRFHQYLSSLLPPSYSAMAFFADDVDSCAALAS